MHERRGVNHLDNAADTHGFLVHLAANQPGAEKKQGRTKPLAAETGDMIENLVNKRFAGLEFPAQELIQPFHLGLDRPIDGIQIQRCLYSHLSGPSPKFPRKKPGLYSTRFHSAMTPATPAAA